MITLLLDRLREARVVLESPGPGRISLHALFPDSHPLEAELVSECRACKTELLAYLDFVREADRRLLETSHRLAASWPEGCHLPEYKEWRAAEEELTRSYWTLDADTLGVTLMKREQVAFELFAAFRNQPYDHSLTKGDDDANRQHTAN